MEEHIQQIYEKIFKDKCSMYNCLVKMCANVAESLINRSVLVIHFFQLRLMMPIFDAQNRNKKNAYSATGLVSLT